MPRCRVVMVTLPSPWLISDRDMPNLGALYIASYLRENGVDVKVADLCGVPQEHWQIPDGDVYGISLTTPQFHLAQEIAAKLRRRQPNCLVVSGGYHPTALPNEMLEKTETNIAVVGDGEKTMLRIAQGFHPYDGGSKEVLHGERIEDVDELPFPARDLIDIYSYQQMGTNAVVGTGYLEEYLITSRGCPFRCGYCAQMSMSKFRVRNRSLGNIRAEMEELLRQYKPDRFYMFDDIFVVDRKRTYEFDRVMREMRLEWNFDWHCLSRTDIVCKAGPELLVDMAASGCKQITYGVEHASDVILKRNHKDATCEQNRTAIQWTVDAGIRVRAQMIVGLPGETRETVEETADFIRNSPADSWGVHIFVPLPGSPIWDNPAAFGFAFRRDETYKYYQTIGKPGEWAAHNLHVNAEEIREWAEYLRDVAGKRNVHQFDVRNKSKPKEEYPPRFGAVPSE